MKVAAKGKLGPGYSKYMISGLETIEEKATNN
jgi:hypothetical protein